MNERASQALIDAALRGTRQIVGSMWDLDGGRCATAVLCEAGIFSNHLTEPVSACPECGATEQTYHRGRLIDSEWQLIVHLNNDHRWGFLDIARKLGPTGVPDADA